MDSRSINTQNSRASRPARSPATRARSMLRSRLPQLLLLLVLFTAPRRGDATSVGLTSLPLTSVLTSLLAGGATAQAPYNCVVCGSDEATKCGCSRCHDDDTESVDCSNRGIRSLASSTIVLRSTARRL